MARTVSLDPSGKPLSLIDAEDERGVSVSESQTSEQQPLTANSPSNHDRVPLSSIHAHHSARMPLTQEEMDERAQRMRDEFEGWNVPGEQWSDGEGDGEDDPEMEDDEVQRLRAERNAKEEVKRVVGDLGGTRRCNVGG